MPTRPLHRRLAAEPATVPALRTAVTEFAERCGMQGRRLHDLRLAVSEAVTNAVVHAYRDAAAGGEIALCAHVEGGRLVVRVTDAGCGLNARPDSPGAGIGLPLIASVADDVQIETVQAPAAGTSVTMRFRLP
jgi:serine/threonine-protein kinase RsbW/stage II sporulation protein AB (anti-sigma F factor)